MAQTVGQLERDLSQRLQAFYREKIGQRPSHITCQLFDSTVAVVLENALTPSETLLYKDGKNDLAATVGDAVSEALRPELIQLVEQVLGVTVTDLLSDSTLETGRHGLIIVLDREPEVRNPTSLPKHKPAKAEVSSGS